MKKIFAGLAVLVLAGNVLAGVVMLTKEKLPKNKDWKNIAVYTDEKEIKTKYVKIAIVSENNKGLVGMIGENGVVKLVKKTAGKHGANAIVLKTDAFSTDGQGVLHCNALAVYIKPKAD